MFAHYLAKSASPPFLTPFSLLSPRGEKAWLPFLPPPSSPHSFAPPGRTVGRTRKCPSAFRSSSSVRVRWSHSRLRLPYPEGSILRQPLYFHGSEGHLQRPRARCIRDPPRRGSRSSFSSPRSGRRPPASPPQRAVLSSTQPLNIGARAVSATPHKPLPMHVCVLLRGGVNGAAASNHHRHGIPRRVWPPSLVL